jgi:hypothetical protein
MNAGNTQVVGEDIPPIESVFDLKSGVRAWRRLAAGSAPTSNSTTINGCVFRFWRLPCAPRPSAGRRDSELQ